MNYTRQRELLDQKRISQAGVTIIGCGALGSAAAMALAKMGVNHFDLYDDDGVDDVNLPNQMYRIKDGGQFKVDALYDILQSLNNECTIRPFNTKFHHQNLQPIVLVTTDSMHSRQEIWDTFQAQPNTRTLIEGRMGAEEGQIYTMRKVLTPGSPTLLHMEESDRTFYQERLYSDKEAIPLPCTGKAVIYNVFMMGALLCRAFKACVMGEPFPREVIFGMAQIHKYSFMVRE